MKVNTLAVAVLITLLIGLVVVVADMNKLTGNNTTSNQTNSTLHSNTGHNAQQNTAPASPSSTGSSGSQSTGQSTDNGNGNSQSSDVCSSDLFIQSTRKFKYKSVIKLWRKLKIKKLIIW